MLKDHNSADLNVKLDGKEVKLAGFIHSRRDHGKIVFIDLRDSSGLTQVVIAPDNKEAYKKVKDLSPETVVQITGKVKKRPSGMVNKEVVSGTVEIEATGIEVLSKAKTPVFEVDQDSKGVKEAKRLKYRYLDLRTTRMSRNIQVRHQINQFCRDYLGKQGFIEVETPNLTKGTPEGAREYIIPARIAPGKFYVLPQSPQQFKQLLMVSGVEKYFQIARCFRDEDLRSDRQAEFTQLDIEMAYVEQEDILKLTEGLLIEMVKKLFPEKKITETPIPRMTYDEAMKKYKTDRPDIRKDKKDPNELGFCFVVDFPLFEMGKDRGALQPVHHPFTKPKEEDIELLDKSPEKAKAQQYDVVLNGTEIFGGSIRITDPELQKKIFQILGIGDDEIKRRFGHMLKAFSYGVPPHGGIASGQDRLISILAEEENIREVIAFPKTGDGRDLLMEAPNDIDPQQLKELGIELKKD